LDEQDPGYRHTDAVATGRASTYEQVTAVALAALNNHLRRQVRHWISELRDAG
jgi:hypothetical protein